MPKIIIDKEKCIGCGACKNICPQGVFELKDNKSEAIQEEECIGCMACQHSCPVNAIKINLTEE
jgi:NAD-dependent dihydropyrimidine dehydrogenase PreA subunit